MPENNEPFGLPPGWVPARPHPRVIGPELQRMVLDHVMVQQEQDHVQGILDELDEFPQPKKVPKLENQEIDNLATIYGVEVHPRVTTAMAKHTGAIIKGVELEIEHFPVHWREASSTGFTFTEDGSLRNNGAEAVSHPNNTPGLLAVVEALWNKYEIEQGNFSDRTSIHVHANVSDFTKDNFKSLVLAYQLTEELLFDFIGEERAENIFCVPWYEAGVTVGTYSRILDNPRNWQKYTALNLAPVSTQGSVEFRHMEGHADIGRLKNWLALIDDIMLYAKNTPSEVVEAHVKSLNTVSDYGAFLSSVFPNTSRLLTNDGWQSKLARGVVEAKQAMIGM